MSAPHFSDIELGAWLDGEAPKDRREAIERWLKTSPDAGARVDGWRRQNEIIRARFAGVASEHVPDDVWPNGREARPDAPKSPPRGLAAVGAADAPIQAGQIPRLRGEPRQRLALVAFGSFFAGAAAAFVAVAALGFAPALLTGARVIAARPMEAALLANPLQSLVRRAAEANQTYVRDTTRPVEVWSDDIPGIGAYLTRRVGFAVVPPVFEREGPRLLGGRIATGDTGPAALLVYEELAGERYGLLMSRAPSNETTAPQIFERKTSAVAVWIARGVAFALVGPKDPPRLLRLAAGLEAKAPAAAATR